MSRTTNRSTTAFPRGTLALASLLLLCVPAAAPQSPAPATGAASSAKTSGTASAATSGTATSGTSSQTSPGPGGSGSATAIVQPLPLGYGKLHLGMTRDEVIAELQSDPLFAWRGPEDVSLLPSPNQSLIEVSGVSFVRRAFFQFDSGKLWVIILELADDRVDHYGVWTSLVAKYGQPTSLDPSASVWDDGKVRVSLERPLTLRYLDLAEFARLKDAASAQVSVEELDRRAFLGGL